jgi:hypothetical protein
MHFVPSEVELDQRFFSLYSSLIYVLTHSAGTSVKVQKQDWKSSSTFLTKNNLSRIGI